MRPLARLALGAAAACSRGAPAAVPPPDMFVPPEIDAPPPHRHTITLDGTDDFTGDEMFATTSSAFSARVTWDDANLYIGYAGPDLATNVTNANEKWLFVYLDTATGGEAQSEMYNTQRATFPAGFAADYYARYKVNGSLTSLRHADAGTWSDVAPAPSVAQAGTYVEMPIPLAQIGVTASTQRIGVVTYMINEKMFAEGTYAGIYPTNFADSYAMNMILTAYLEADFTSARAPNDPAAKKP